MFLVASGGCVCARKRGRREVVLLESDMDGSLEVLSQSIKSSRNRMELALDDFTPYST